MRPALHLFLPLLGVILFSTPGRAHHPNEGSVTLEELLKEAQSNSLELKEAESRMKAADFEADSKRGSYFPSIALEGGPVKSKFDNESASGNTFYGKALWNLYRGGADQAEFEKAKIERNLEKEKFQYLKSKVSRKVKEAYFDILFVLESIGLNQGSLEMNQEQMKIAKAKRGAGFTSQADVLEFELRESTLQSDLKLLEQTLKRKSKEIAVLIGRPLDSELISIKGHLDKANEKFDRKALIANFKSSNIELKEAQANYDLSLRDYTVVRSQFLPEFNLEGRYGRLATEEEVFKENNNYSVMLKVTLPLFSGFETLNARRSALAKSAAQQSNLANMSRQLATELENTLEEIESYAERLKLEEKNLDRSESYYRLTLAEYKRGVKNSPDMVGASERLTEARLRNLEFRKNIAIVKLKVQDLVNQ